MKLSHLSRRKSRLSCCDACDVRFKLFHGRKLNVLICSVFSLFWKVLFGGPYMYAHSIVVAIYQMFYDALNGSEW